MGYKYTKGRTKELKEANGLCSPFFYPHHDLRSPKDVGGLRKYQGYRRLAGLFQFQTSPPLTFRHRVTWERQSSETSLDNSKLSLANVLIIADLVMRGWA